MAFLGYRYFLDPSISPTYYNLARYLQDRHWSPTRFNWLANFSEKNFEFDIKAAEQLEFKHLLAQLHPEVMPQTYYIDDYNWSNVLSEIASKDTVWILKPALLNNGQHIKIFQNLDEIEQHYLNSNRLGGEHVLQEYLTNPDLLKGHKYSVRMFVVVTNYAGAYLYPFGYFTVARQPYQPKNFSDIRPHLTNEHLQGEESNVIQIPSSLFDFFPEIYAQIKYIITDTLRDLQTMHPAAFTCDKQRTLAIFGFDFIVDTDKQVWLLEANHGPCFPTSDDHPLQKELYFQFWQSFIDSFVYPIANRQAADKIQYDLFEKIRLKPLDSEAKHLNLARHCAR